MKCGTNPETGKESGLNEAYNPIDGRLCCDYTTKTVHEGMQNFQNNWCKYTVPSSKKSKEATALGRSTTHAVANHAKAVVWRHLLQNSSAVDASKPLMWSGKFTANLNLGKQFFAKDATAWVYYYCGGEQLDMFVKINKIQLGPLAITNVDAAIKQRGEVTTAVVFGTAAIGAADDAAKSFPSGVVINALANMRRDSSGFQLEKLLVDLKKRGQACPSLRWEPETGNLLRPESEGGAPTVGGE